jgi:glutathione S-transferase
MADYTLFYWPIPFRGQFVRAVLAHAGKDWDEPGADAVAERMEADVAAQPAPFMAPPLLHDRAADLYLAQLPAILAHLGAAFDLIPEDPRRAALTHKIVGDAHDVLEEVTRHGGEQMWTQSDWDAFFAGRLPRWMGIFEETGLRHGLGRESGHILGTEGPGLADLVTTILWFTMADKLPRIEDCLQRAAPRVAALSHRVAALPAIVDMRADTDARFGDVYCGGEIERSLRRVLA